MSEFIKIALQKSKVSRTVLGVAINDAKYKVYAIVNGNKVVSPSYRTWKNMLERCLNEKYKRIHPTYMDATICDEWLLFSNFDNWYDQNFIAGYDLDKDIKVKGNKTYSPEFCMYVPKCINYLLLDKQSARGKHPIGVHLHNGTKKDGKRYQARLSVDAKVYHIGLFYTPEQASNAYIEKKNAEILRKCGQYPEFSVYLRQHLYEVALNV